MFPLNITLHISGCCGDGDGDDDGEGDGEGDGDGVMASVMMMMMMMMMIIMMIEHEKYVMCYTCIFVHIHKEEQMVYSGCRIMFWIHVANTHVHFIRHSPLRNYLPQRIYMYTYIYIHRFPSISKLHAVNYFAE